MATGTPFGGRNSAGSWAKAAADKQMNAIKDESSFLCISL
jgi:hypothetical protein